MSLASKVCTKILKMNKEKHVNVTVRKKGLRNFLRFWGICVRGSDLFANIASTQSSVQQ